MKLGVILNTKTANIQITNSIIHILAIMGDTTKPII